MPWLYVQVQNQLEWLCQTLQVTAEEAQAKFTLCEKLQTELAKFFPGGYTEAIISFYVKYNTKNSCFIQTF